MVGHRIFCQKCGVEIFLIVPAVEGWRVTCSACGRKFDYSPVAQTMRASSSVFPGKMEIVEDLDAVVDPQSRGFLDVLKKAQKVVKKVSKTADVVSDVADVVDGSLEEIVPIVVEFETKADEQEREWGFSPR